MSSDAHAHPADLAFHVSGAEEERRALRVSCAASAWNLADFEYCEELARSARNEGAAPAALCFAVHPQLPAYDRGAANRSLDTLDLLSRENRLQAVGEAGFDLYGRVYRDTEKIQEEIFAAHLELALSCSLPMVLHVRRAMHKVFAYSRRLKRLPAVVFHSYSGTLDDGKSLLRRGINAYFSFGAIITLNHKAAMAAAAALPLDRLLTETDAPYQPPRGAAYSRWSDLDGTAKALAELRGTLDLRAAIDENWRRVFHIDNIQAEVTK